MTEPVTLADHERLAQARIDPGAWAYLFGGAADEITLRDNSAAWQRLQLRPRVLRPLAGGHTRRTLLGRELAHPLLVAPMAYQRLAHPQGERASALAAAVLGLGYVLSTQASVPLEEVAHLAHREAARGPLWFQLYLQPDRALTRSLVDRAEAAGYEALVLTVDAPVQGSRDQERRTGFQLPPGVAAVHLPGGIAPAAGGAGLCAGLAEYSPTWEDLAWLRSVTRLPILLKGITHPDDARLAVDHGAAGVIVSNHGGRTLDTLPATAALLPGIVAAVEGRAPVLVDGGVRRGTDVFKALALGASAVLLGRPVLHGLANAGAAGAAQVLRLVCDELEMAMVLCGCRTLDDITTEHVQRVG
ncbi:alpha-hydroxy acid oxidase [Hydrogenophaga pseudoflava]|uniref:alpha-hydroxy acid oxidase n=1 Tax=Hydrogenophaga pseudoflava TaxID=47421 RepID=UPI0027E45BD4|nr:alpha-hydroxy acid oxidase [Hydrogenophaga pseudoflava]MDQ7744052.1 alpha-hydroxy acid oxidase [Hydrogenophaga pseudoflava]